MQKLITLLNQLESNLPNYEKLNTTISAGTVGWHIEHTLLATTNIIEALKKSNPEDYKWEFNTKRFFVFTSGKIPRGRGKAPESVRPAVLNAAHLKTRIDAAKTKINELSTLNARNYFQHFFFGKLNVKATIKFLNIHIRHHLNIIKDIVKRGNNSP
jgi:DinB superfamily